MTILGILLPIILEGEIYSKGNESTIVLGASSTLTNSGSIKNNKSVTNKAIQLKGE